jgi:hypothetical protein
MILGLVLTIELTQLLWLAFSSGSIRLAGWGILAAVVVSFGYYGAYRLTDYILASSVSHQKVTIRNAARSYTNCTSGYRFCRLPSTGSVEFTCGK